jgi:hypothetical protein
MTSEMPRPELPVAWDDLLVALHVDGSLRDLIVLSNEDRDWQAALEFTRRFVADGKARMESEPALLPRSVADIFKLRTTATARMKLFVGPLQINCHFFGNPIEFDIDPSEARTPAGATALVEFVEGLGQAVGMPVSLTEENMPDAVWLSYHPGAGMWHRGPTFEDLARDIQQR